MTDLHQTARIWEEGSSFKCAMSVKMPNGATMSFFGEGKSSAFARQVASFKASVAATEQQLAQNACDDDSSGTEEDDYLEAVEAHIPSPEPTNHPPCPEENVTTDRSAERELSQQQKRHYHKQSVQTDPAGDDSDVELVWTSDKPLAQPIAPANDKCADQVESGDEMDDELPLNILQGKLGLENGQSSARPVGTDLRHRDVKHLNNGQQSAPKDLERPGIQDQSPRQQKETITDNQTDSLDAHKRVASAGDLFPANFEESVASPEPKSSGENVLSCNIKRKDCTDTSQKRTVSRKCGTNEGSEATGVKQRRTASSHFEEQEGEVVDLTKPQREITLDKPVFQNAYTDPDLNGPRSKLVSRVDEVRESHVNCKINATDSESDFDGLAFYEAKPISPTPPAVDVERGNCEPPFRQAPDTHVMPPSSPREDAEDLDGIAAVRSKSSKSPSPLFFKGVTEDQTFRESESSADPSTPVDTEEFAAYCVKDKLPGEASDVTEGSDEKIVRASRALHSSRRKPRLRKTKESVDADTDMFDPNYHSDTARGQYPSLKPLRKQRPRPGQVPAPKRRKVMQPASHSVPVRVHRSDALHSNHSRSDGEVSHPPARRSETLAPMKESRQPAVSECVAQEGGGWNVVPQVNATVGGRAVIPIPRKSRGTKDRDSHRPSGESIEKEPPNPPTTLRRQKGPIRTADQRANATDRRTQRIRTRPSRGMTSRPVSIARPHSVDIQDVDHVMSVPQSAYGMHGMTGDHIPGPGMNQIPGMPWFPGGDTMAQAHPLPQHGIGLPLPHPNMFMPVLSQSPYFTGAVPNPNMYAFGPSEHPQTQWQRHAVSAAWLDHQIQTQQRAEKWSRSKKGASEPDQESHPREKWAPQTRDKSSPETPDTAIEGGEYSSGDDEDGEDHISTLHVMTAKLRRWTLPDFDYGRKDNRWVCSGSVRLLPFREGDKPILKTVSARNRKKAKQKASKHLLSTLKQLLSSLKERDSSDNDGSAGTQVVVTERSTCISTAIGALNQLWHWHKLDTQPDARFEELEAGKWRCTFVMTIPEIGTVNVSDVGPQKKVAKSSASFKALERLRELKVIRPDEFASVKQNKVAKEDEERPVPKEQKDSQAMRPKVAKEDIVQMSDEEGEVLDMEEETFDGRFRLPNEYSLVIASSAHDCDVWRKMHAESGSEIGVYIDSWNAREVFDDADTAAVSKSASSGGTLKDKILCFCDKNSALVVRGGDCRESNARELYDADGFWIPEAVRILLKDGGVRKHGHSIDDGLMSLRQLRDIRARAVNDISISSAALGSSDQIDGTRVLRGMGELTKHWLKKEVVSLKLKDVLTKEAKVDDAPEHKDDLIGMAVLSAFGSLCIQEQLKHASARKTTQVHGAAAEFRELSKRLMHNPFES